MVEYTINLDDVFASFADRTRRDILQRLTRRELSISELAAPYNLTFAAISKHVKVLEKARLISKRRKGKEQIVHLAPQAFAEATVYLGQYRQLLDQRLDALEDYLNKE